MNPASDVVIVGGGVIGLLTARELRAEGLSVTVLERGRIGMASSRAGGGILSPVPPWDAPAAVTALAQRSYALYPRLAESLNESTGIDVEYHQCGALLLAEQATISARDWATSTGQTLEVLDRAQLREREPQLSDNWHGAISLPGLAQLRNPRLTEALHRDLQKAGVVIVEQTPVTGFRVEGDKLTGVQSADGDFDSGCVVVAAGAWTATLLDGLLVAAIEPVRGQMLWYQLTPGTFNQIVVEGEQYLIPRRDGVCLVGSTVEHVGFDDSTTTQAGEKLAAVAARLSPVFEQIRPAGQWSGLRPGAPDGIPVISRHPKLANLFVNAGHYRNGINLGPASAGLMADLVLERQPRLDPAPYLAENHL